MSLTVVVPTRDRPEKLGACLAALERARPLRPFDAVICDSSGPEHAAASAAAVARHAWARRLVHDRDGPGAARNLGAQAATGELLVYLDDDVYVEPEAIARLAAAIDASPELVVLAGTLDWGEEITGPLAIRPVARARPARPGEPVEFVISALLCLPRALSLACPWDEARRYYDDRFMCLLWRRYGARLDCLTTAHAIHDEDRKAYPLAQERHRVYASLFDACFLRRSPRWALSFWVLGFLTSAKGFARTPRGALGLVGEWLRGTGRFLADLPRLRQLGLPPG